MKQVVVQITHMLHDSTHYLVWIRHVQDHVTSPKCPKQSVSWIRQLLLLPPSPNNALDISSVCSTLARLQTALPDLYAGIPAARISETISSQQGGRDFFAELIGMSRVAVSISECNKHEMINWRMLINTWKRLSVNPWSLA